MRWEPEGVRVLLIPEACRSSLMEPIIEAEGLRCCKDFSLLFKE